MLLRCHCKGIQSYNSHSSLKAAIPFEDRIQAKSMSEENTNIEF